MAKDPKKRGPKTSFQEEMCEGRTEVRHPIRWKEHEIPELLKRTGLPSISDLFRVAFQEMYDRVKRGEVKSTSEATIPLIEKNEVEHFIDLLVKQDQRGGLHRVDGNITIMSTSDEVTELLVTMLSKTHPYIQRKYLKDAMDQLDKIANWEILKNDLDFIVVYNKMKGYVQEYDDL